MRVRVATTSIHTVRYFHVTRNFALDTVVRLALHLALLLELLGVVLHLLDRAPDQLYFLELVHSFVGEVVGFAGGQALRFSLLVRLLLDAAHVIIHRLLLLQ